jgi:hypothetical protein
MSAPAIDNPASKVAKNEGVTLASFPSGMKRQPAQALGRFELFLRLRAPSRLRDGFSVLLNGVAGSGSRVEQRPLDRA